VGKWIRAERGPKKEKTNKALPAVKVSGDTTKNTGPCPEGKDAGGGVAFFASG